MPRISGAVGPGHVEAGGSDARKGFEHLPRFVLCAVLSHLAPVLFAGMLQLSRDSASSPACQGSPPLRDVAGPVLGAAPVFGLPDMALIRASASSNSGGDSHGLEGAAALSVVGGGKSERRAGGSGPLAYGR